MSESTEGKARMYLVEGRIKVREVTSERAEIDAYGSSDEPYKVRYNGVWSCSCPAQKIRCAHVIAAVLITDLHSEHVRLGSDAELDELLPKNRSESPSGPDWADIDL